MREPLNSYEISYVIKICKPNYNVGTTFEGIAKVLSRDRMSELRVWASDNFDRQWFLDHR